MKIINILINTVVKLLTIILSIAYSILLFAYCNSKIFPTIFGWILCVFIVMTSFVDMIRPKKIDIKYNLLNLVIIFLMLFNIFTPYVNSLLLNNLISSFDVNLMFSYSIFEQNFLSITVFMIITLVVNFKFRL